MYTVSVFLSQKCDNRCVYCYGHDKADMPYPLARDLVEHLRHMSFSKISFAGGEPLLWSHNVFDIMAYAKSLTMVTELITNGNKLQAGDLIKNADCIDILTIDVDSLLPGINSQLGRISTAANKAGELFQAARKIDKLCKVNTVVTSINYDYVIDMCQWIKKNPAIYRWKVFQFLPSSGRALRNAGQLSIPPEDFHHIATELKREMTGWDGELIVEDNDYLASSYASVDQYGHFYTAIKDGGVYKTIQIGRVLDMTIDNFLGHPRINRDRFLERSSNNYIKLNHSRYRYQGE